MTALKTSATTPKSGNSPNSKILIVLLFHLSISKAFPNTWPRMRKKAAATRCSHKLVGLCSMVKTSASTVLSLTIVSRKTNTPVVRNNNLAKSAEVTTIFLSRLQRHRRSLQKNRWTRRIISTRCSILKSFTNATSRTIPECFSTMMLRKALRRAKAQYSRTSRSSMRV